MGRWSAHELLHGPEDLERWLGHVLDVPEVRARSRDLPAARELREALWELAQARVSGRPLVPVCVEVVNAFAAAPPPVRRLGPGGAVTTAPLTVPQALSALARDAIDLLGGPLGHRLRTCAAPDCELLFVDASRPGRRRWCSMERCGNRAKTRAYRRRRDDEAPTAPVGDSRSGSRQA